MLKSPYLININFDLNKDQFGINVPICTSKIFNVELLQGKQLRANPQISLEKEQTVLHLGHFGIL